ncbi:MAG: AMP-binding protein [Pseudomonadota bacterium]
MVDDATEFYDHQEIRDPDQRHAQIYTALPGLVRHAVDNAPALARHLAGTDPAGVTSPAALAALPVLRKSELIERQATEPPFAGLVATPISRLARVFASPGPIAEPEGLRTDYWRCARALYAAGFRTGDLVHNAFSYHLTPAGMMIEGGARALGCPVLAAGTGQTARQLQAIDRLRPVGYAGTPSFLRILLDEAADHGADVSAFTKALVSGEAFPPTVRDDLQTRYGVAAYQCYATADAGLIAYETRARDGLIGDEAVIIEIVHPGTGDPVDDGEVGELVITSFNPDYPLIRFATGDLSAVLPGASPCGRTNRRIRGWLGRADQSAKVRGMFVHPHQVAAIAERHELGRSRIVIDLDEGKDRLRLLVEAAAAPGLAEHLEQTIRETISLRGEVHFVAPGSLPDDGKVIEDRRS